MTYIIYWIDLNEPQIIPASKSEFETVKKTGVLILNNLGHQTTIHPKYIAFIETEPIAVGLSSDKL